MKDFIDFTTYMLLSRVESSPVARRRSSQCPVDLSAHIAERMSRSRDIVPSRTSSCVQIERRPIYCSHLYQNRSITFCTTGRQGPDQRMVSVRLLQLPLCRRATIVHVCGTSHSISSRSVWSFSSRDDGVALSRGQCLIELNQPRYGQHAAVYGTAQRR